MASQPWSSSIVVAFLLAFILALFGARPVRADGVCVETEQERDRFGSEQQPITRQVLENAVLAAGMSLGPPCTETWKVSHVQLGAAVHVLVKTSHGGFTATAPSLDQIQSAYDDVVRRATARAIVTLPAPPAPPASFPVIAPATPISTPRLARGALYLRIGYGLAPATSPEQEPRFGPQFGLGYRRPIEGWLFDVSLANVHVWKRGPDYDANFLSFLRISGARLRPTGKSSAFYYGAALSFGQPAIVVQEGSQQYIYDRTIHSYSLQGELVLGYEALRDKALHIFFEGGLVLPFDRIDQRVYSDAGTGAYVDETYWAPPTITASIGVAI